MNLPFPLSVGRGPKAKDRMEEETARAAAHEGAWNCPIPSGQSPGVTEPSGVGLGVEDEADGAAVAHVLAQAGKAVADVPSIGRSEATPLELPVRPGCAADMASGTSRMTGVCAPSFQRLRSSSNSARSDGWSES